MLRPSIMKSLTQISRQLNGRVPAAEELTTFLRPFSAEPAGAAEEADADAGEDAEEDDGGEAEGKPEEGIELLIVPFEEMVAAARGGKVRDVKTAFALLMAATASPLP